MPGRFVDGEWTEDSDSSVGVIRRFTYERITDVNRNQGNVEGPRANLFKKPVTCLRDRNVRGPSAESNGQDNISQIGEKSVEMSDDDDEDVGREKDPEESEDESNLSGGISRHESVDGSEANSEADSMEVSAGGRPEVVANFGEDSNGSSDETDKPNESDVSTVKLRRNKRAREEDSDMEVEAGDAVTDEEFFALLEDSYEESEGNESDAVADEEIPAAPVSDLDEESEGNEGDADADEEILSAPVQHLDEESEGNEDNEAEGNGDNEESEGNSANDSSSYVMSSPSNNPIILSLRPRCTDHVNNCETRPSCVHYWMEKLRQSENSGERKKMATAIKTASYCAEKHAKIRKIEAEIDILRAQSRHEQAKTQLLQLKIERHRRRHPGPTIPE